MKMNLRKIVFISIMSIVLILSIFIVVKGINLGPIHILGVTGVISTNKEIEQKNSELATGTSSTYNSKIATLEQTAKSLQDKKEEYENEAILVSAAGNGYISTTEKYEIEFLWTRLGNYAKDENVDIKIDVTNSSTSGTFDLNFTVTGSYVGITDFIYDIENDSKLGFKIESFEMQASGDGVQATFSCKEININIQNVTTKQPTADENATGGNTTNNNTANNTTNSTANNTITNNTTTNNTTVTTTTNTTSLNTSANNINTVQ